MIRKLSPWIWPVLQLSIAALLLSLLWRAADGPAAARSLAQANWVWLVLAVAMLTLQTILSAMRWRLTALQLGMSFGTGHAIREYYLAQVINQSLPGGMIGDAGRAYRAREQAGLLASGQAVVIERLIGQIAMFLTLAAGFLATSLVPGGLDWPRWLALVVAALLLTGLLLPPLVLAATRFQGVTGRGASAISTALRKTLADRKVLPGQIALSIGTTLCNLSAFAFCAYAVGVALPLSAIVALVPLILFTMLIPISVSGWGLREGAAAALLPLAGATASGGLASSVAFGLCFIVAVLPGVIFLRLKPRASGVNL
ncbi:lysylphosphatidylglycerol synthase transmembrane domain-containing protein [Cognatishimia sp. MH4019]|uniref:lysylphosphatidylglycerol synthase transmembrane domain-containing protein n=1 Tax=Cognatishimia sp. MH4019 TaxID=2854030 RepID=UPI001CD3A6F0|nr:lysylphosphatidylglycerol synthase transmembrane domain-containing protein [Cognatishimia sp. MH4019]